LPTFDYRGLNSDGVEVDGRLSASDEVEALRQLEAQRIAPFKLDEARLDARKFDRAKARPQDRFRFMRQLSVLLRAGTPLLDAFESIAAEEPCRDLATQANDARRALRSGARLSDAVRTNFSDLPPYAPRLLELGEATGQLPKALADIATQMEHELKSAAEIRNALAYPSLLAVAGLGAITFIFLFVVPRFAALLGDDRSALPAFSRWVIETGVFMRSNLLQTGVIAAGVVLIIAALARNPAVRRAVSEFLHQAPVVGSFLRAAEIARWARACGTALSGGAPLIDALVLAEDAVTSVRRRQGLVEARRAIRAGEPIDEALKAHADFDSMTVNLVRTGRASASLDEMLLFIADLNEEEARNRAKRLTSLAEPLAVLFIAAVVGAIVVSLVMAMTSLYDIAL
jgi:type II secretory pathway component PulF